VRQVGYLQELNQDARSTKHKTTNVRWVTSLKSADLIYAAAQAWKRAH